MAHDPKAVANYILECAQEDGEKISPMKLLKLTYLAHGWTLGLTGQPLITEHPEAWRYGPVIPSLYHDFKEYGHSPVDRWARWPDWSGDVPTYTVPKLSHASDMILSIIQKVWSTYKRYSGEQLSALTHQKGTPWYITWHEKGGKDRLGTDIADDLIQSHYEDRVRSTK